MSHRIFLYGTLRDPDLFEIVAGTALVARPAVLPDHAALWAEGEGFPLIVERQGADQIGAFGLETKPVNPMKIIGLVLVLAGAALVQLSNN